MGTLYTAVGTLLVALALLDALWTTLAPHGAGPLTKYLARGWWAASLAVHRRLPGGAHGLLAFAGPALLVLAVLLWTGLLWAGWTLLFSAEPGAVVDATAREPAGLSGRVYYVGFVLFTLGTGDYVPVGEPWEVLSAVASFTGLFVVTLAITYVLSVVSAVAAKRQLAGAIYSLGATPGEVVVRAWDRSGFEGLGQHLSGIAQALGMHTQRHLAYPVLHYFHSGERRSAFAPNAAVLGDALLLLAEGVAPDARPAPAEVGPVRRTLDGFLDTLSDAFISPADEAPAPPSLQHVASAGIPTVPTDAFAQAAEGSAPQRRRLLGLVEDAGWTWSAGSGTLDAPARALV
jgi:hypothetical protein